MKMTDKWLANLVTLAVEGVLKHGLSADKVRSAVEAAIKGAA